VLDHIKGFTPKSILEIGAANGWRLKQLRAKYGCKITGIDPSVEAIKAASADGIHIDLGTCDRLPYKDESFDLIIFGFCLCFISPEDWFDMVKESNRVLRNGGLILLYDFVGTKFFKRRMMKITADSKLEERPLYLYNFNWPELWLAHPAYSEAAYLFDLSKYEICTALVKNVDRLLSDDIATAG
jgi:SAM-dependent methyltransferase